MRIVIAGVIGGIVMFVWGAVAHMVLPIGEMGFRMPSEQQVVLDAVAQTASGEGVYMYPTIAPEKMSDKAAMQAFAEDSKGKPYALVIWQPGGNPANQSMVPNLVKQFLTVVAAALVLGWAMVAAGGGFGRRVLLAGAFGLFAWISLGVPMWNWYMFPTQFTLGMLIDQIVGWLLAGAAMAWWLGRRSARH